MTMLVLLVALCIPLAIIGFVMALVGLVRTRYFNYFMLGMIAFVLFILYNHLGG